MMNVSFDDVKSLLDKLNEPEKSLCLKMLDVEKERFCSSPGSSYNHQIWPGGYIDHIAEVMKIAVSLYEPMKSIHSIEFTLHDALLVLFLHDVEKPFKYLDDMRFSNKAEKHLFRLKLLEKWNIKLNDYQMNALKYVEGENEDYLEYKRVMNPLAAFCHVCDISSARIWFGEPKHLDENVLNKR